MRRPRFFTFASTLGLSALVAVGSGATEPEERAGEVVFADAVESLGEDPARGWVKLSKDGWLTKPGQPFNGLSATAGERFFLAVNFPQLAGLGRETGQTWQAGTYTLRFEVGDGEGFVFVTEAGGRGVQGGLTVGDPTDFKQVVTPASTTGVTIESPTPAPTDGWTTYAWTYTVAPDATFRGEPLVGQPMGLRLLVHNGGFRPADSGEPLGNAALDNVEVRLVAPAAPEPQ